MKIQMNIVMISSEGSDENLENPPDIIKQLNEEHRKNQEMETRAVDEGKYGGVENEWLC